MNRFNEQLPELESTLDRSVEGLAEGSSLAIAGQLLDAAGQHTIGRILFGTGIILGSGGVTALTVHMFKGSETPGIYPES